MRIPVVPLAALCCLHLVADQGPAASQAAQTAAAPPAASTPATAPAQAAPAPAPATPLPAAAPATGTPAAPAAAPPAATPPAATPPAPPEHYTIVSQGGVSKGAWQAGFAYYFSEWRKAEAGNGGERLQTVAGASAGAVNGLIAAMAACEANDVTPSESLFFEVWVERLGLFERGEFPGLFPKQGEEVKKGRLGLFSGAPLDKAVDAALARFYEAERYVPGCKVNAAFTTTHLSGRQRPVFLDAADNVVMHRASVRERFALAVEPRTASDSPRVRNNVPTGLDAFYAELGQSGPNVDPKLAFQLTRASGAFPGAFQPVELQFVETTIGGKRIPDSDLFIDGGVFNNTPVNLAIDLNTAAGTAGKQGYLFLEPNVVEWEVGTTPDAPKAKTVDNVVDALGNFVMPFANTSMDAEFFDATQRNPFLRGPKFAGNEELQLPVRKMPIVGAELGSFFGFLDRDLRLYDFYVGMADAHAFLASKDNDWATPDKLAAVDTKMQGDPHYATMAKHYAGTLPAVPSVTKNCGDLEGAARSECNYHVLIRAMSEYRTWLKGHEKAKSKNRFVAFSRALAGETATDIGDATTCEATPDTRNLFWFSDLAGASYGNDVPNVDEGSVNACGYNHLLRQFGDQVVSNLKQSSDGLVRQVLEVAGDPALTAATGIRSWPWLTLGAGLGMGPEGFVGLRTWYGLRTDVGLRPIRLMRPWRRQAVTQRVLSWDTFLRLLWVQPLGSLLSVDPYVGGHVGAQVGGENVFGGPLAGLRLTLLNRASFGLESRLVYRDTEPGRWLEASWYFSYQFFPWAP